MMSTNELRERVAETERIANAGVYLPKLKAELAAAEAQEAEVRDEAARREQSRCLEVTAIADEAAAWRDEIETHAAGLVKALAGFEGAIGRLAGHVQQQSLLGDILSLVVTRAKTVLGYRFGAPALQGSHSLSLSETVTRSWLLRLAGAADDKAA